MGVLATQLLLLAASISQAQLVKEFNHFPQSPLQPILFNHVTSATTSPTDQVLAGNTTDTDIHVFSSKSFARGRGISIITTHDHMPHFNKLEPLAAGVNDMSSAPFTEHEIPGKGRGLIASKFIHRGDRIFAETPVLLINSELYEKYEDEEHAVPAKLQQLAVEKLPPRARGKFWELYGQPVQNAYAARIDPNAFDVEIDDGQYYAVVPETARLNHDCRPNAGYYFDQHTLAHYVYAISDITPGTEISITYIDPHMPQHRRKHKLLTTWGFNCSCSSCSLSEQASKVSDERLARISKIHDTFEKQGWETQSSRMVEAFLSLIAQEKMYTAQGDAFEWAALVYCAEGRYWDTIKYAYLAEEMLMLEGAEERVEDMRLLVKNPTRQKCWRTRSESKSEKVVWDQSG